MRNRIDITEVEAATKIRAKYLRALENEEWDLLPGPTFVKTFLRTYATTSGSTRATSSRSTAQRYERPSARSSRRSAPTWRAPRARRGGSSSRPWMLVASACSRSSASSSCSAHWAATTTRRRRARRAQPTPTPTRDDRATRRSSDEASAARPDAACGSRSSRPAPVSVCLEDARGHAADRQPTLDAGERHADVHGQALPRLLRHGAAVMRVDGKPTGRPATTRRSGTTSGRGRKPRPLPRGRAADVRGMSVRAGHRRHGHRGARRASSPTATARGSPSACASAASSSRTSWSSATGRPTCARRSTSSRARGWTCRHVRRARPDGGRPHRRGRRRLRGRAMVLDAALEERIMAILAAQPRALAQLQRGSAARGQPQAGDRPGRARRSSSRSAPRPGSSCRRRRRRRRPCSCCPARRGELQPMWEDGARHGAAARRARRARASSSSAMLRLFGVPESEIALTLRAIEADGVALDRLEITTCLRRGEIEIATVFAPDGGGGLRRVRGGRSARATATRCSPRTARRSTSRSPRCSARAHDRRRGVLHRRADGRRG